MVKAKKFVLLNHFKEMPEESDFEMQEEILPPIKDGEFLAEALYLSVDPYMRSFVTIVKLGSTMVGGQIAKIIESKNPDFPVNKHVFLNGWRTHSISDGTYGCAPGLKDFLVPDLGNYPISLGLGMLGMPGNTAYFGFLEVCKPKPGETVVVTTAAGSIGSHVGQIAKLMGCKVIGIAGSDEKLQWCRSIGFDHVINYKTADLKSALVQAAPDGIDCYFDNVGGEMSSIIIQQMNSNGRISACGWISSHISDPNNMPKATCIQRDMIMKQLKMKGFNVTEWHHRWMEGIKQNLQWLNEGKLQYKESITVGFENMPKALAGMFKGENVGKALVKV